MSASVRMSRSARRDMLGIWSWIAERDENAARNKIDRIEDGFLLLARNPRVGRRRPELVAALRSFAVDDHIVFYRPIPTGIYVVRVLHGRRNVKRSVFIRA